ncbi:MAG: hypothetical protein ACYCZ0_01195 [Minisyncoccota bacterium]
MSHIHRHSHPRGVPSEVTLDAWLVVLGLVVAVVLVKTDVVAYLATITTDFTVVSSFIIGLFFTSILTTTPAIVAISEYSNFVSPVLLALVGAAGAVCGDLLIFRFVRSPLANYFVRLASHSKLRAVGRALDRGPLWWIVPALGALVIASPLPDELGLLMMGLSHIRLMQFIMLSYVMNAVGIFAIAMTAQSVL